MKVALIGATGFVGTALLDELLNRGHQVSALTRNPAKLAARSGLSAVTADAYDAAQVAQAVEGHDVVLSAFNPGWNDPALYERFTAGHQAIVDGVKRARAPRLVVIGGAGSLYVAPGVQLVDTPAFTDHVPPNIVPGAKAARDALSALQQEPSLNWTLVSPPAMLQPGPRTGAYRLGGDQLLMNGEQPAGISVADLAVAVVDELEKQQHLRRRFTVAH
jgi:putative NADH-flavin reductase